MVGENFEGLAVEPALFPPGRLARLRLACRVALGRTGPLMRERQQAGLVRQCHGDLHLRNVCLIDGRPTLFDATEFNDAFAVIDVLYDLAFLLMDSPSKRTPRCRARRSISARSPGFANTASAITG